MNRRIALAPAAALFALTAAAADPPPCLSGSAPLISDKGTVGKVKEQIDALDDALGNEHLERALELLPELKDKVEEVKDGLGKVKDPLDKVDEYVDLINEGSILFYATQCLNSPTIDPSTPVFAFAMGQAARSVGELGKKLVEVPDAVEFARDWIFDFFVYMENFFTDMHRTMSWCLRHRDFCVDECNDTGNFCEYKKLEDCTEVPPECFELMALARDEADADEDAKTGSGLDAVALRDALKAQLAAFASYSEKRFGMPAQQALHARSVVDAAFQALVDRQTLYADFGVSVDNQKFLAYVADGWAVDVCAAQAGIVEAARLSEGQVQVLDDLEALERIDHCDAYLRNRAAVEAAMAVGTPDRRRAAAGIVRLDLPASGRIARSDFGEVGFRVEPDSDRTDVRVRACVSPDRACREDDVFFTAGGAFPKGLDIARRLRVTDNGDRWDARARPGVGTFVCAELFFFGANDPVDRVCRRLPGGS